MKLTFITGKGGVGKSAVTAALATALASLKYKVGVVELGETRMADFFGTPPPNYEGTRCDPYITLFNLDAPSCFQEYAGLHLPKQALLLLKNRWVHHFIDATPGLNEILLLGKITSLLTEKPRDFLLIDAPATGHTISLCDAPRIALQVLKHGPLKSTVGKIWDLLHLPNQTSFLLVTQLENFIVEETIELYRQLTQTFDLSTQGLLINGQIPAEETFTKEIPGGYPAEARPLAEILLAAQAKQSRQQTLFSQLKKEIPLDFESLRWEELVPQESCLRQELAAKLKPWVLKNYLKKNA